MSDIQLYSNIVGDYGIINRNSRSYCASGGDREVRSFGKSDASALRQKAN